MPSSSASAAKPSRRRLPISREREGDGFVYRLNGRRITRRSEIERLEALAVPPAWEEVEIARSASAKVLARGVDAAGRAQAIYHPVFRRRRDRQKFDRLERFGAALPKLRARVDRDLRGRRLGRDRVTACVVRLIDLQFFRVGNPEYAKRYQSFGITTVRTRHLDVSPGEVEFDFMGKSGKRHRARVRDARVARLVQRLVEIPGHEVFRFFDEDDVVHRLRSRHVNDYVKRHMGEEFTAKDFRTWGGTLIAATALLQLDAAELASERAQAKALRDAIALAAERLGNTPAVVKSSYIDPRVLQAAHSPEVLAHARRSTSRKRPRRYLEAGEQRLLALLAAMK